MALEKYVLTVAETAALMGYGTGKIYQLIHEDVLKAYKDEGGRIWHVPATSIADYVNARIHRRESKA